MQDMAIAAIPEFATSTTDVAPNPSSRRARWERRQELKEAGERPVRSRRGVQAGEQRRAKAANAKPYTRPLPKTARKTEKKPSQPPQPSDPTELQKARDKYRSEYAARLREMKRVWELEKELATMRAQRDGAQAQARGEAVITDQRPTTNIAELHIHALEMRNALLVQRTQFLELSLVDARRRYDSERARRLQVEQDSGMLGDRNAQVLTRLGQVCQSLQQARTENAALRSQLNGGNMRSDPTIPVIAPPPYAPSTCGGPPQYAPPNAVAGGSAQV